jgi:hypothetical protein
VKLSDLAALEKGPKGVALECSRRSTRLALKCRGWTIKLTVLHCCLPTKVVSRRLIQGHVPYIPYTAGLPPFSASLLLLLPIAPVCQADSSGLGLPDERMLMILVVTLDVVSSWLMS